MYFGLGECTDDRKLVTSGLQMHLNETQIQQKVTAGVQSGGMAPLTSNTQDTLDVSTHR